ncbi:hypothetical protein FRB93_001407 [Tulasnella sp. JGI-2019a]|nr:hypothetical protein FRB93_001407 [Tulasnella sp. JGI-2019a]
MINTWTKFKEAFITAFRDPNQVGKAERAIRTLVQTSLAAQYTSEFNQHATEIKIQKVVIGWGTTLEAVQQEAITVNNLLFEAHQEEHCQNPRPPQPPHFNFQPQQQVLWNHQGQFQSPQQHPPQQQQQQQQNQVPPP